METTLGKRIVHNRKRLGLTQDQLAEQLGVTAQAVSKWENDQSCPDITMLPRLAEIFGISTDALLGREAPTPVYTATVEDDSSKKKQWEFHFDAGRKSHLCFAVTILAIGILYFLSKFFHLRADLWEIIWPTIPLVYGLFGIFPGFSLIHLGCALAGCYFLVDNLGLLSFGIPGELLWPVIIVLIGIYLLTKALRKPRKANISFKGKHPKPSEQIETGEDCFDFSASFGEDTHYVSLDCLREGKVSTSFGAYTIDLSGVGAVAEGCSIELNLAFGELELLVPKRFWVKPNKSSFLAQITLVGEASQEPEGVIYVNGSAAFGEIVIRYI